MKARLITWFFNKFCGFEDEAHVRAFQKWNRNYIERRKRQTALKLKNILKAQR